MYSLLCYGLSHKTAPVTLRERITLSSEQHQQALSRVAAGQVPGVTELAILSTCNRFELIAIGDKESAVQRLIALLAEVGAPLDPEVEAAFYCFADGDCVTHLFEVAAGLDSQVLGDSQILGQIGDAYQQASASHAVGTILSALMKATIHTGKRVRHETPLSQGALSISAVAVQHAVSLTGSLHQSSVLVIGAGKMARIAAEALSRRNVGRLLIANRTLAKAQAIADEVGGTAIPFNAIHDALIEVEIVISAVRAPHSLIYPADIADALAHRQSAPPLTIFDVAIPRNIAPGVAALPGVRLYNLDDLEELAKAHLEEREHAIPQARAIVSEECLAFARWQASRAVVPTIQQLRAKAETVRRSELDHLMRRLPDMDEHDQRLLEDFSQRLVNKLLHNPTTRLKSQSAEGQAELYASVVDDLFDLGINRQ